jgi:hypothetical protein
VIESVLTNYHDLFHKVCLSSPLPIRDLYASSCPQITVVFITFCPHTLITIPVLPPAPQNALLAHRFPACPPRHPCCLPLAQAILLELETEAGVILTPLIKLIIGETDAG